MGNQVIPLPIQYMQRARELCTKYELLLIFDEIVTAFGRTGYLFASQYYGTTPDIMCLAKGITGGYAPLGAVLTSEQVFEQFNHAGAMFFANGSSTDGHPVSCAAGLATLRAFEREDVIPQARERFTRFREELQRKLAGHELVAEVRGVGALLGIEVVDQGNFDATMILLHHVRMACERRGVLVHFTDGVLVLVPPLTSTDDELALLGETVTAALDEVLPSSTARRTA
jgi:adenosylmethionine-8-amino-7-oxononanoate aminotransferase